MDIFVLFINSFGIFTTKYAFEAAKNYLCPGADHERLDDDFE
jgi:hypothetical protein